MRCILFQKRRLRLGIYGKDIFLGLDFTKLVSHLNYNARKCSPIHLLLVYIRGLKKAITGNNLFIYSKPQEI